MPLAKRFVRIDFIKYGNLTMSTLYQKVKELEDRKRPIQIELEELLSVADTFISSLKEKKI